MRHLLIPAMLALLTCAVAADDAVQVHLLNSDPLVRVHSNFRGETVTLFGTIQPSPGRIDDHYEVVVVVEGPSANWVVREKQRQAGLVLNGASAHYVAMPTYYALLSSEPLARITADGPLSRQDLSFKALTASGHQRDQTDALDDEFIRLMRASGRFVQKEHDVVLHSPTSFSVRLPIASDAANGLYFACALVFADGKVVGRSSTRFTVRTQGLERFVADLAQANPLLYGLATIALALVTGWLGGVLFKR